MVSNEEFLKRSAAIQAEIANHRISVCEHEKQIAMDKLEIEKLRFNLDELRTEYALQEGAE